MKENKYIPTIGLEIHAELKTKSKMFCSCINNPDEETPNKNICPVCLAHPGTLPILNKEAIKHVIKIGISVNGKIADFTEWDRKNYFYPDIPKGYQISQYKYPLVSGGSLAGVSLERIHLEEDTAQSTHDTHKKSLVNFNRSGVPLMELVTKPVIHDSKTAVTFAKELQLLLRYLKAGDANMEKGEMRVEANISIASPTDTENGNFGTKTEIKNLNSFRAVAEAIEFEIERQSSLLDQGEKITQETRGWDDVKKETYSQRSKESSHDYRYFPDPDIPKLKISTIKEFSKEIITEQLPELPWIKRERYKSTFNMTDKEVAVFIESAALSSYFEAVIETFSKDQKKVKLTINYILSDYLGLLKNKENNQEDSDKKIYGPIDHKIFSSLIEMIFNGDISSRGAKELLNILIDKPEIKTTLYSLAEENGLIQKSDSTMLIPIIEEIIKTNKKVVDEYKAGKLTSLQFLIGQTMKVTKGSANPEIVKQLLIEKLG